MRLKNYCGYRDAIFDFTYPCGEIKPISCFFGANGSGKSTLLYAIEILCNAYRYYGKDVDLLFRKITYHPDYDPSTEAYKIADGQYKGNELHKMELHAIFDTPDGDKEVVIDSTGVVKNELPLRERMSFHYFIDADNPMNLYKFQLHSEMKERFLELARIVYGLECFMGSDSPDLEDAGSHFYTDFIIKKTRYGQDTKVHFKRMSDGERKIATLLRDLCNPIYMDMNDIILIDNVCMHIYKDRHAPMINKIMEVFSDKQFFITTHSPILVGMEDKELGIVIEPYLKKEFLYDVESSHCVDVI